MAGVSKMVMTRARKVLMSGAKEEIEAVKNRLFLTLACHGAFLRQRDGGRWRRSRRPIKHLSRHPLQGTGLICLGEALQGPASGIGWIYLVMRQCDHR